MIEIEEVSKTYNPNSRKANTVLFDASLSLPDKGFIFIIGKSGIGKSTILNAVGGLMSYEGEILYDGKKVDIEQYRKRNIGYVFQDFLLFDELSVRDNIKIVLNLAGVYDEDEISRRVALLLKAVGLNINSKRRASALSLGQRQRVAIARALASSPKIILADEPTGNLDAKNSLNVMDILKGLSQTKLVVCVTHNINLVKMYADRAYAIIDKQFQPVNPASLSDDGTYAKQEIDIGSMSEKDFQEGNILLRLFVKDGEEKKEINIISQNGKVLVVGDNISLATPEQVKLAKNSSEKKEEEKPAYLAYSTQLVFEEREEKRSWQDNPFISVFKNRLFGARAKRRFGAGFVRLIEIVIPLIIFILLDAMFVTLGEVNKLSDPVSHQDEQIYLVPEEEGAPTSLSQEQIYKIVSDSKSGIADIPSGNFFYNASIVKVQTSFCSLGDFSASDKLLNRGDYGFTYFQAEDIDVYKKFPSLSSTLGNYNLKDDEIVMDTSIFSDVISSLNSYGGNFLDSLPNTYLDIPIKGLSIDTLYQRYKIVGVVSTSNRAIYANKATTEQYRKMFYYGSTYASGYNANSYKLPDYSDFLVTDYDSIASSAYYTITRQDPSISDNVAFQAAYKSSKAPLCYLSDTARPYLRVEGANSPAKWSLFLQYDSNIHITYNPDPSKKVIALVNYTYGSNSVDSTKTFALEMLYSSLRFHSSSTVPEGVTINGEKPDEGYGIVVPSALTKFFKDLSEMNGVKGLAGFEDKAPTFASSLKVVGTYDSSSWIGDIYTSGLLQSNLEGNMYALQLPEYYTSYNTSPLVAALTSGKPLLTSYDVGKTKQYFKDNYSTYKVNAYTYAEAYYAAVGVALMQSARGFLIAMGVLTLMMILIIALDNASRINKNKYHYGVLRCLGMSKSQIVLDDLSTVIVDSIFACVVPTVIALILLSIFGLFAMSWWYLVFLLGYFVVVILASELPLIVTISKKPIDIIHTLS